MFLSIWGSKQRQAMFTSCGLISLASSDNKLHIEMLMVAAQLSRAASAEGGGGGGGVGGLHWRFVSCKQSYVVISRARGRQQMRMP